MPTSEFVQKYVTMEHPRKCFMSPSWEKLNKVLCTSCSNDWGIEARWEGCIDLPLIKIEGFRVLSTDGKVFTPKKWKKCPFAPIKGNLTDLLLVTVVQQDSDAGENSE